MSKNRPFRRAHAYSRQSGQTNIFIALALGLFLILAAGLAVDYSNVWFHRQAAQAAADAACQAGAMDMLVMAQGGTPPAPGFSADGTDRDCASDSGPVPCKYAALNGYNGVGLVANTPSNSVKFSFPGSVTGVTTPPSAIAGPHPFMQVDLIDRISTYFSGILSGNRTQDVPAQAVCGLQEAQAPIPIIVLNPTCQHAFEISGSASLKIIGGPSRSVQVNSNFNGSQCATAGSSSSTQCGSGTFSTSCPCTTCAVDLCQGGPNFTGSGFGTFGSTGNPSFQFAKGTSGYWAAPSPPIADPFQNTPAPADPVTLTITNGTAAAISVAHGVDGCPDASGCDEYYPGKYTQPIVVQNRTAIFVPGIYYMTAADSNANYCGSPSSCSASKPTGQCYAAFAIASNGVVRPADCRTGGSCGADHQPHTSDGTMFYFTNNSGGAAVVQNAGARTSGIDQFDTTRAKCPGGTDADNRLGLPTNVDGNVLMGQCTKDGTYTTAAPTADDVIRGLLFFQDHAITDIKKQTSFQGSGSLLLAGTVYATSTSNSDFVQLQGTPGSGTFVLGEIVTDQLVLSGNGAIGMQLNPNAVYHVLKVALLK